MSLEFLLNEYLDLDKNEKTRNEMISIGGNKEKLTELLATRLEFGTAGLRAKMGAGYNRMNELTVIQATQGICCYLLQKYPLLDMSVVIGHDHRHNSLQFAQLTGAVFLSRNIKVFFLGLVHTPMVPFTVVKKSCVCGIMITASHNPKDDNGYKVYAQNGCQIIPPMDSEISCSILNNLKPWIWSFDLIETSPLCIKDSAQLIHDYYSNFKRLLTHKHEKNHVKFCYTPMHGVGYEFARKAFDCVGLSFEVVPLQKDPHPDFPTVEYPNPEEGKAMEHSDANDCKVIFANDPDADRLAVAEKVGDEWKIFTGNELGVLLASFLIEKHKDLQNTAVLTTTVSSHMLLEMAKQNGIHFEETLTGFKWLGNKAIDLEKQGKTVIFAYEEAIGYMVSDFVKDKDGISALAVMADCTNYIYKSNSTLNKHLDSLYQKYGYFASKNSYLICHDRELIKTTFNELRQQNGHPNEYPTHFNGCKVIGVRDLTVGYDSDSPDLKPTLPCSSSSQMITFKLENGCIITLRTSGTEPKVKYYTELRGKTLKQAQQELDAIVESMLITCLSPLLNL